MPRPTQPHLRCDKLIAWLRKRLPPERQNMTAIAEHLDVNSRSLWRWTVEDIPFHKADEIAVSLGVHPVEIWGDDYWEPWIEEPA